MNTNLKPVYHVYLCLLEFSAYILKLNQQDKKMIQDQKKIMNSLKYTNIKLFYRL